MDQAVEEKRLVSDTVAEGPADMISTEIDADSFRQEQPVSDSSVKTPTFTLATIFALVQGTNREKSSKTSSPL